MSGLALPSDRTSMMQKDVTFERCLAGLAKWGETSAMLATIGRHDMRRPSEWLWNAPM
jgi:hypothetical protein